MVYTLTDIISVKIDTNVKKKNKKNSEMTFACMLSSLQYVMSKF